MAEARQLGRLWAKSEVMHALFVRMTTIAQSDLSVVIQGETGTGKELVAEALHKQSPRTSAPYMVVDCASVPRELIESELFGHTKGSFTGALNDRKGAFEAANRGTIFIDEIGELPLDLQPRLLRVLEKQEVRRVGNLTPRSVDVRVIAATNRDLSVEVEQGRFREDLFFRLNVVQLNLPALRERPDDIVFLAERFLEDGRTPDRPLRLGTETQQRLQDYAWPGNVRELRNLMERGSAMSDRDFRLPEDFGQIFEVNGYDGEGPGSGVGLLEDPFEAQPGAETALADTVPPGPIAAGIAGELTRPLWQHRTYKEAKASVMADFEIGFVQALLKEHRGNVTAAAKAAGMHRNVLHRMMARCGIER